MSEFRTCPQGHQWQPADAGPAQAGGGPVTCPVCGTAVELPTSAAAGTSAPDTTTLLLPAARVPPDGPSAETGIDAVAVPGYEILRELGRGGMGVVYKARQLSLNRVVALKMILSAGHAAPGDIARFRAEAEALARLQHPNIIQIHEVEEQDGRPFFSLEFVEGGSLAEKLDGRPQPPQQSAQLVEVLARAMHAAHQRGIIHRDLKPGNVLLTADGVPKITDFGLAKRLDGPTGQTRSGAIIGTPGYMAPEQAGGRSKATGPATDVYALGAILYEMLTGQPPFHADTPLETVLHVVSDEPPSPRRLQPNLPRDLEAVCLKCLEKDPGRRYASARDLADDLARFQRSEPTLARPLGPLGRLTRWAHQRPRLAVTWSALLLLYGQHLVQLALESEGEGGDFHWFVTELTVACAVGAALFQWLLGRPRWRQLATYGWTALDVAALTAVLLRGDGPHSALLGVYPLLVAGAALRFRISLVWFVTGLCVLSYAGLQAEALWRRPEMAARAAHAPIFLASLLLLALILHFLLRRAQSVFATEA